MSESHVIGEIPNWDNNDPRKEIHNVPEVDRIENGVSGNFDIKSSEKPVDFQEAIDRFSDSLKNNGERKRAINEQRKIRLKKIIIAAGIMVSALLVAYGVTHGDQVKSSAGETIKSGVEAVQVFGKKLAEPLDNALRVQDDAYKDTRDVVNEMQDQKEMETEAAKHGLYPEAPSAGSNIERGGAK